jgi:hypothetical protein
VTRALQRTILHPKAIDKIEKLMIRLIASGSMSMSDFDNLYPIEVLEYYAEYKSVLVERASIIRVANADKKEWSKFIREHGDS